MTEHALTKDFASHAAALSVQHEAFAVAYVELDNASAAYRRVYTPHAGTPAQQIWSNAARIIAMPDVALRVRQLRDAAAVGALISAIDLMRDLVDIAKADPNEISSVVVESCRQCHGAEHAYHWVDELEYARAYDAFVKEYDRWALLDAKTRQRGSGEPVPPSMDGGFGYDPKAEPAIDCPFCFGRGNLDVVLHDTTKLSPAARKLYKSAEKDRFGAIKVNIHDQDAARDKLLRMLGAYKDGGIALPGTGGVVGAAEAAIKAGATDEEATRGYLQMVQK